LLIEYDGTQYYGFQWQLGLPTVQSELERAIGQLCGQSSRVMAASRTDTGVHAKGQVVGFWAKSSLDTMTLVRALNHYLPGDIAVKAAYRVSDDFDVRRDALSREYRYYILNRNARSPFSRRFALFLPKMLDIRTMNEACEVIQGEHDFASFASSLDDGKSTVRNVCEAGIEKQRDFTVFRIVANSFLHHQVRSTVGLLIRLGICKIGIADFRDIMEARSVGLAGPLSPACGLCLTKVNYPKPLGG
jgi:tRNA pseudouridine38-40 synthase